MKRFSALLATVVTVTLLTALIAPMAAVGVNPPLGPPPPDPVPLTDLFVGGVPFVVNGVVQTGADTGALYPGTWYDGTALYLSGTSIPATDYQLDGELQAGILAMGDLTIVISDAATILGDPTAKSAGIRVKGGKLTILGDADNESNTLTITAATSIETDGTGVTDYSINFGDWSINNPLTVSLTGRLSAVTPSAEGPVLGDIRVGPAAVVTLDDNSSLECFNNWPGVFVSSGSDGLLDGTFNYNGGGGGGGGGEPWVPADPMITVDADGVEGRETYCLNPGEGQLSLPTEPYREVLGFIAWNELSPIEDVGVPILDVTDTDGTNIGGYIVMDLLPGDPMADPPMPPSPVYSLVLLDGHTIPAVDIQGMRVEIGGVCGIASLSAFDYSVASGGDVTFISYIAATPLGAMPTLNLEGGVYLSGGRTAFGDDTTFALTIGTPLAPASYGFAGPKTAPPPPVAPAALTPGPELTLQNVDVFNAGADNVDVHINATGPVFADIARIDVQTQNLEAHGFMPFVNVGEVRVNQGAKLDITSALGGSPDSGTAFRSLYFEPATYGNVEGADRNYLEYGTWYPADGEGSAAFNPNTATQTAYMYDLTEELIGEEYRFIFQSLSGRLMPIGFAENGPYAITNGTLDFVGGYVYGPNKWQTFPTPEAPDPYTMVEYRALSGKEVTVKLLPDYGYQYESGSLSLWNSDIGDVRPDVAVDADHVGSYTFTMVGSPVGADAKFVKTPDLATESSTSLTGASVASVDAAPSVYGTTINGNALLEVSDFALGNVSKFAPSFVTPAGVIDPRTGILETATAAGYQVGAYLNVTFSEYVSKNETLEDFGSTGWTQQIGMLDAPVSVGLTLASGLQNKARYAVAKSVNGTVSILTGTYDEGVLTFDTNRFTGTDAQVVYAVLYQEGEPTIDPVNDIVAEAAGASGTSVGFFTDAYDWDGSLLTPKYYLDYTGTKTQITSPYTFPIGVTTVTAEATSPGSGQVVTTSFTVTVRDTTAPSISISNQSLEAGEPSGRSTTFRATVNDAVSGGIIPKYYLDYTGAKTQITSPRVFPLGTTTVTVEAVDGVGNKATKTFTVTVSDTTAPQITVSDKTAEATLVSGALVTFSATAEDVVSGAVTPKYYLDYAGAKTLITSPRMFPIGITTVTVEAVDSAGNKATEAFTVTVSDTTAPDAPLGLGADVQSTTEIILHWDGVIDPSGIDHYTAYFADGTKIAEVDALSCRVSGLTAGTTYSFYVTATDGAGGTSGHSAQVSATTSSTPAAATVYRFYNVRTGAHFYTASETERDLVIQRWPNIYTYEGVAYSFNGAPGSVPLHRFYNRVSGAHFYTASEEERLLVIARWSNIFTYEGVAYYVSTAAGAGKTPIHRFYNVRTSSHFYTASETERDLVIARWPSIFTYEGVAYYVP